MNLLAAALTLLSCLPALAQGGPSYSAEERKLVSALGLAPGQVVAEIGAGEGRFAIHVARTIGPTGRVFATELGAAKVEFLKSKVDESAAGNLEVLEAQTASTGLPRRCCDAIYMRDVYHHLSEPAAILADVKEALRPGGRLLIIDFEPQGARSPVQGVPEDRRGHGIPVESVVQELEAAGFEVISQDLSWRVSPQAPRLFAVLAFLFASPGSLPRER